MARYREKDQTDLDWNRIRRKATMVVRCEIRDIEEEVLNIVLSDAWRKYSEAIGEGRAPEIETEYTELVKKILDGTVPRLLEAANIEAGDDAPVE